MASKLITDDIWNQIKNLLPERSPRPSGGRPPLGDREVLTGVLFVLKTGIAWEDLPEEMGSGCGMTCLRRLKQWQQAGVWSRIEQILRFQLRNADRFDWHRAGDGTNGAAHPGPGNGNGDFELATEDTNSAPGD